MAGKPLKKSSLPGVSIRQLAEEIPEGCSLPDFEQKPITMALQEGRNAVFRVMVCGEPRPEVYWHCTKGKLSNSSKYRMSAAPGSREHMLQINQLTGEDAGLYRCIAVNTCGEAVCSARLIVIEVGFRKSQKRHKEPQKDLRKELMDFRNMLKKRTPPPEPKKKVDPKQVWQQLMMADRRDYEQICRKYGIVDYRGILRKLQQMQKEQEDKMAQYVNAVSNLRHIKVTKEGVAVFDLELDLKDPKSKIYLYKDGEMVPYGFDDQTKHCLRRLGKRYLFQIQDLRPEDAGIYQVKVEDAEVFSTELEARAIPPRVVVPLAEARCEEQDDAVFECTLSNICPNAAWHFQHRPIQPSDKYKVLVSPDGLTHQLLVRETRCSDMGLYSLSTGLHISSAWLVVEDGKDKGLLTTSDDYQLQEQGAQAAKAEDFEISGKGGKSREQDLLGDSLDGAGLASALQLTAGPELGGRDGHSSSLMGNEGAADSIWGQTQVREGFSQVGVRVTLPGENELHRKGDWGGSLPGKCSLQGEGLESASGFMEDQGRDSNEDRCRGRAGDWEAGSRHTLVGGQGSSWEGKDCREDDGRQMDSRGQEQHWDAQMGFGKRVLLASPTGPLGSWPKDEVMKKILQGDSLDEMEETDILKRERGKGVARAGWGSGTDLGEAGIPGVLESPGRRESSSKAGMDPGSWGSQKGRDADQGKAWIHWGSGQSLGQTFGGKNFQEPSVSDGRKFLLGGRSPEAKSEEPLREADDGGPGESMVGGRGYRIGFGGPGGMRWEGSPQDLRGRGLGCRDSQETAGALDGAGNGSKSLQPPQDGGAGQRGAVVSGRTESDSTDLWDDTWSNLRKTRGHDEPGVLGSGGEKGDLAGTQVAGLMESGQGMDARSPMLVGSPGLGAQGLEGIPGSTDGLRVSEAKGLQADFWKGSWGSGVKGPRGRTDSENGLVGPRGVEFSHGVGFGYSRGICPENEVGDSNGSGVLEEKVSGIDSEEGGSYKHGSGMAGELWSGNKDGHSPGKGRSGRVTTFKKGSRGPDGGPMDRAGNWNASRGQGGMSPGRGHCLDDGLGSPRRVGSVGRGGLGTSKTVETVGEGHVDAEPSGSGRIRSWGQTGDYGSFRASGALWSFGEGGYEDGSGGPGAMKPGSLRAGGKVSDGDGTRRPDTQASGAGIGYWDDARCLEALAPQDEADPDSQWANGSSNVLGCGDGAEVPGPQETGGRTSYGGGLRGLGPGNEAGFRDGLRGLRGMGSGGEASYRKVFGAPERMGSGNKKEYRDGFGGSRKIGSGDEANYKNALKSLGRIPFGDKEFYTVDLRDSGSILSWSEVGCREGLQGTGGMSSGNEVGYRGGSGGPGEMGSGGEIGSRDGSGRYGVTGSFTQLGHKGGPRDQEAMRPESGYWVTSEGSYNDTSSKDGPEWGKGLGFVSGAVTLVDSGMAGMLGMADRTAHRVSSRGPGVLGTQGEPEALADGQGFRNDSGGYGTSGVPKALRAVDSKGKSGSSEWQDGLGIPGSPRDRQVCSGEGKSADRAGGLGASWFLDGRERVKGETWAGTAALEFGREGDFWRAGPGRGGAAVQRGLAPQGSEDLLLGGREMGAGWGSSVGAGQALNSSAMPRGRVKSASGAADGPGVSNSWVPGCKDQGLGQGSRSARSRLPSFRVSSSLQEKDADLTRTHEGREGSRSRGVASGQGEPGRCPDPWSLDSKVSGPRKETFGGPEHLGVLGKGDSTEQGNVLILKSGDSGPQGAWNDLDSPFGRKGSGDRIGAIQSLGPPLGQAGGRKVLQEQGSLDTENDKTQGSGTLEDERQGTEKSEPSEESGGSNRRLGPLRNRSQTWSRAESGVAKRWGADEVRGMGQPPWGENRVCPRGKLGKYWRQEPPNHLGSRRGGKEGRLDFYDEERDATRSPRPRYKPSTGGFSKEAQDPTSPFSQGLTDTKAQEGEATGDLTTLTGHLGPGTWLKDGVKLTAQDGIVFKQDGLVHRLLIARVQGTQAGRYTFVAGHQQSEVTLTVQGPPTIAPDVTEKLREPLAVKAGKPVTLKIPFKSRVPVQAAWRKDGAEVADGGSNRVEVALGDSFTRLCLPSASRKDCGRYSVTLRSEGGSVQAELTLQVIDKPHPPQGPLEVQDQHGAGVCLGWRSLREDRGWAPRHHVVERRQASRRAWLKVGEPPADSTTSPDPVEQGRKYSFCVRAVASDGAREALEPEEVLAIPEATPGPSSSPAILAASSRGITLMWMAPRGPSSARLLGYLTEKCKMGSNTWTPVNSQPGPAWQGCPGPVQDLQVTDTSHTRITLSWARLDAQNRDKVQGNVVELHGSVRLQWSPCHMGTVAATTYTAKELQPQKGYFMQMTAAELAHCPGHAGASHARSWKVLSTPWMPQPGSFLGVMSHIAKETFSPENYPKFLMGSSKKDPLMVRAGDILRVPVSFDAALKPEVTWMKDGFPLLRSVTTTKDGLTQLLIPSASRSDSGLYTVTLRNLQGKEATYNFFVKVAASPQSPGRIHLRENVPGTVTAEWEPSPDEAQGGPLHYAVLTRSSAHGSWREAADRIHTNRFTLLGVLPGHEYHFRVVAKNELGSSEPSDTSQPWCTPRQRARFTVQAPSYREPDLSQKPRFLVGLRSHLLPQGCECCMSCAVRGSPRPRLTWFKDGRSLEGNPAIYSTDVLGVCSLVIPSVSPQDRGEYKAVAENRLGRTVSTATLIVIESSS